MDGGGLHTGGLLHPPGGPACGGAADDLPFGVYLPVEGEQGLLGHGFARTRPAGEDGDGATQGGEHCLALFPVEGQAKLPLDLGELLGKIVPLPFLLGREHRRYLPGQLHLGLGGGPTIHPLVIGNEFPLLHQAGGAGSRHQLREAGCVQQLERKL